MKTLFITIIGTFYFSLSYSQEYVFEVIKNNGKNKVNSEKLKTGTKLKRSDTISIFSNGEIILHHIEYKLIFSLNETGIYTVNDIEAKLENRFVLYGTYGKGPCQYQYGNIHKFHIKLDTCVLGINKDSTYLLTWTLNPELQLKDYNEEYVLVVLDINYCTIKEEKINGNQAMIRFQNYSNKAIQDVIFFQIYLNTNSDIRSDICLIQFL